ncbi:helix-turn-helix domain-containing protein [Nocardia tengchongensis]|uniref:AlbA family DNA-binding domain-containing protein n=1 Tax=Nocardia tengchongensis TaxID=2055889 RepID=UPI0036AE281B
MLSTEEIEYLLALGYERREFEVKGPGLRSDRHLVMKVVRAALSLGNLQDGGHVIIGIDDKRLQQMEPGLNDDQVASWLEYDQMAIEFRKYSDPPLRFDLGKHTLSNGKQIVAIQVFEFTDSPHLCAKEYPDVLRKGALYVRSRGVPETSEVASSVEMREVLELASAKRLREFFTTADRAGMALSAGPTDDELYAQQREQAGVSQSAVVSKIKSRGHWMVSIRPERYQVDRLQHSQLDPALAAAVVRRRGWPVPFIDDRKLPTHGDDWIGQDIDAESVNEYESWRFFESGQFNHLRAVSAEWRMWPMPPVLPPGFESIIEIWEILYYLTELFELAGRLGLATAKGESMTIAVTLNLRPNTALIDDNPRHSHGIFPAPLYLSEKSMTVTTENLVSEFGPLAARMAIDIFSRFGWNPTLQQLQILQRGLYQ